MVFGEVSVMTSGTSMMLRLPVERLDILYQVS